MEQGNVPHRNRDTYRAGSRAGLSFLVGGTLFSARAYSGLLLVGLAPGPLRPISATLPYLKTLVMVISWKLHCSYFSLRCLAASRHFLATAVTDTYCQSALKHLRVLFLCLPQTKYTRLAAYGLAHGRCERLYWPCVDIDGLTNLSYAFFPGDSTWATSFTTDLEPFS